MREAIGVLTAALYNPTSGNCGSMTVDFRGPSNIPWDLARQYRCLGAQLARVECAVYAGMAAADSGVHADAAESS